MWFGFGVLCPLEKSVKNHCGSVWIDSLQSESIQWSLWLHMNRFTSTWIDSCMNRLTKLSDLPWIDSYETWIISIFILGSLESIHICIELFHSSCFSGLFICCLNWFKNLVNQFNLLILCKNWVFSPLTTYTLIFTISKIIESFASILSRSQKLIVHTFFKIKHFFLESLCSLSVYIL